MVPSSCMLWHAQDFPPLLCRKCPTPMYKSIPVFFSESRFCSHKPDSFFSTYPFRFAALVSKAVFFPHDKNKRNSPWHRDKKGTFHTFLKVVLASNSPFSFLLFWQRCQRYYAIPPFSSTFQALLSTTLHSEKKIQFCSDFFLELRLLLVPLQKKKNPFLSSFPQSRRKKNMFGSGHSSLDFFFLKKSLLRSTFKCRKLQQFSFFRPNLYFFHISTVTTLFQTVFCCTQIMRPHPEKEEKLALLIQEAFLLLLFTANPEAVYRTYRKKKKKPLHRNEIPRVTSKNSQGPSPPLPSRSNSTRNKRRSRVSNSPSEVPGGKLNGLFLIFFPPCFSGQCTRPKFRKLVHQGSFLSFFFWGKVCSKCTCCVSRVHFQVFLLFSGVHFPPPLLGRCLR